jgi:hypothetical protein
MDKKTFEALDRIMEDIAKGKIVHAREWQIVDKWMDEVREDYVGA